MNQERKVSIIVPVYNTELYLKKCIESALKQSYSNIELILINDGSYDKSSEICNQFAEQDSRIKVFHKTNGGEADARNYGLMQSKGDCICFLDSDDLYDIFYVEKLLSEMKTGILPICNFITMRENGEIDKFSKSDISQNPTKNMLSCWRCIFDHREIDKHGLFFTNGRITGADQEFTFKYSLYIHDIVPVEDAIYYYRQRHDSIMHQASYSHFDAVDAMKSVVAYAAIHGTFDQKNNYEHDLINYGSLRIIETNIMNLLALGEPWRNIFEFMEERGYSDIIQRAFASDEYYKSFFYRLWKCSPKVCLRGYSIRKALGRFLRKKSIMMSSYCF